METSLKTDFAQIFSRCPKNLSCPKFGGAAAPLAPPARTPMSITEGIEGDPQFHMYADDTTVYVSAPTYDLVASKLNEVLAGLYTWCCESCLTPHPTKTEYTLLSGCRQLTGPLKTSY